MLNDLTKPVKNGLCLTLFATWMALVSCGKAADPLVGSWVVAEELIKKSGYIGESNEFATFEANGTGSVLTLPCTWKRRDAHKVDAIISGDLRFFQLIVGEDAKDGKATLFFRLDGNDLFFRAKEAGPDLMRLKKKEPSRR